MLDISGWVALASALVLAAIAWGTHTNKLGNHGRAIKELWEKKADGESLRKVETQVEGIDRWTRTHDDKANDVRLQIAERFAKLEQAVTIGMNNHQDIMRLVTKLEVLIEKMEKKFEERLKEVEAAIDRRNTK